MLQELHLLLLERDIDYPGRQVAPSVRLRGIFHFRHRASLDIKKATARTPREAAQVWLEIGSIVCDSHSRGAPLDSSFRGFVLPSVELLPPPGLSYELPHALIISSCPPDSNRKIARYNRESQAVSVLSGPVETMHLLQLARAPCPRQPVSLSPLPPGRLPWSTHAPRQ